MSDLTFTMPALVALLIPTIAIPLVTMIFLRTQRSRLDYGTTRWLFVLGTLAWLGLACWEVYDLGRSPVSLESPFRLADVLRPGTYKATLPRWILLCLPAFPTFFAVLVMFRKRFQLP